jgi:hypothetical protein
VIPPEQNAEFVAAMERVLDLYHLPYHPKVPVMVLDEQPVQLFSIPSTNGVFREFIFGSIMVL